MNNKIHGLLYFLILIMSLIIFIIIPKSDFSEKENRPLLSKVTIDFETFLSGDLNENIETFFKDQFFMKDKWITIKLGIDKLLLKNENNNVLLTDTMLFDKTYHIDNYYIKRLNYINAFANDVPSSLMLVPNKDMIYSDALPSLFDNSLMLDSYKDIKDSTNFIDVYDTLSNHKDEYIYYNTDHHWTSLGAYYGYLEFINNPINYILKEITTDFKGSYYAKAGVVNMESDTIKILDYDYNISICNDNQCNNSFYFNKHLTRYDKYKYFLDGNHPLQIVTNKNIEGKSLLLIKDSYANSMVPFLSYNYDTIYIVDLRYYDGNINELVANVDEILYLFNFRTFISKEPLGLSKLGG